MITVSGCNSDASCGSSGAGGGKLGREGVVGLVGRFVPEEEVPELVVPEGLLLLLPNREEKKLVSAAKSLPSIRIGSIGDESKISEYPVIMPLPPGWKAKIRFRVHQSIEI